MNQPDRSVVPVHDLQPDESLYFHHIHKTAGSSLRQYIGEHFDLDQISSARWHTSALLEEPPEAFDRDFVAGHFGSFLHDIAPRPLVPVTMLRDPVDRTLSAISDISWRKNNWMHERFSQLSIEEFVHDEIGTGTIMNFQTRSLALDSLQREYVEYGSLWKEPEKRDRIYSDPALLERAIQRLDQCAFVGVQDRFDESMRLLAYTFGWLPPATSPRVNVRRSAREELSQATLDRIRELTQLDQTLYERACEQFDAQYAAIDDDAITRRHADMMSRRPRRQSQCFRFERGFIGSGWQKRRQVHDWSGRWTGPDVDSTLSLSLEPGESYTLRLIVGGHLRTNIRNLVITANGHTLKFNRKKLGNKRRWIALDSKIDQGVVDESAGFVRLGLHVPEVYSPSEFDPEDKRLLGIFVAACDVTAADDSDSFDQWRERTMAAIEEAHEAAKAAS